MNLYNLSPSSSKLKDEQKDFKYNYNDKKIQNLGHTQKFIIAENVIEDRSRKLISQKNSKGVICKSLFPKFRDFLALRKFLLRKFLPLKYLL